MATASIRQKQERLSQPHWPVRPIRILGICGSLRRGSYNRKLIREARRLVPAATELELWDGLKALPPFDEDDEHAPDDAVLAWRNAIARADAVLIATPQYNASLPGQLKNALDWASRPYEANVLRGKPVAVIGASPGRSGAARSQAEARTVLGVIGAEVLDAEFALAHAFEQFNSDGRLASPAHRRRLRAIVEQIASTARTSQTKAAVA
jgi:chromate reductase